MGFDQKLKDLLRLQTTRPDAFTAELDEPWSGMRSDIELALGILMEYQRRGKPLRLIEDFQINEETGEVRVLMPEWQTSLIAELGSREHPNRKCSSGSDGNLIPVRPHDHAGLWLVSVAKLTSKLRTFAADFCSKESPAEPVASKPLQKLRVLRRLC